MSSHLYAFNDDATGICCNVCRYKEWLEIPSTGTTFLSNVGSSVQVVLGLPAYGLARTDAVRDCTLEEKVYEAKATPTLSASLERTGNPGSSGTALGVEPLNLLSLIDENYFCPKVSSNSLKMNSEILQETGQKEVLKNSEKMVGKGIVETTKLAHFGLTYLFEKVLTASDCDANIGHLLIPKSYVEAYLLTHEQREAYIRITDFEGNVWSFELLSWTNPCNKMHLLGNTMKCIRAMQWEAGNTLKFYRNNLDGKIVMELKKIVTGAPSE